MGLIDTKLMWVIKRIICELLLEILIKWTFRFILIWELKDISSVLFKKKIYYLNIIYIAFFD